MDALKRKNRVNPNASLADKLAALNQQEQEILAEKDMLIEKSLRQPTSPIPSPFSSGSITFCSPPLQLSVPLSWFL